MKRFVMFVALLVLSGGSCWADQEYAVTGIVLKVSPSHKTFLVSCQSIPGYMDAMTMAFEVHDSSEIKGVSPGMMVAFTLVVRAKSSYAEHIKAHPYESVEQDPLTARRLKLLDKISHPDQSAVKAIVPGQRVPDFRLTDQTEHLISLSQFAGKVVAINFIYTSCALPNFCFRNSNNFGVLQRRFKEQMGKDFVLLTVTFDPQRDRPDVLAKYANTWKADPATWHFLTGSVADVRRLSNLFGVDYFPDEGLMNHSLHTAVIDQEGRLVANIEGNQFTASQLGDLVQTVLVRTSGATRRNHTEQVDNSEAKNSRSR